MIAQVGQSLRLHTRAAARRAVLDALSSHWLLSGKIDEGLNTRRVAFPYFHDIPRQHTDSFRRLLHKLAQTHTFLNYNDAHSLLATGPIDRPYVSFSFDDGFKSNFEAAKVLEEFGTTGCFFVPVGFIGIRTVKDAQTFFGFTSGVDEPAMTWDDLESLTSRGHVIANHTVSHRILSTVPRSQLLDEIGNAGETLRARLGHSRHFAWPYGRFFHFSREAAEIVFQTGHESCASAERGAHVATIGEARNALCIRRDHLMAQWPLKHSLYFLASSALSAAGHSGDWPSDLSPATTSEEK